ncbi:MAG: 1-acyl-sn-glycerol-3-phosphate acyltransferase [Spirochaetaceae bacterium]|jgi:glycerol-3-phosphate O-acyltransferase|nr:1-acyl-sn-glycerol-3-phosphate acyltransferase [Spirochaetaceae bacterium]
METLSVKFRDLFKEALSLTTAATQVTEQNVYQEGDRRILPFLDKIVETLTLPGSGMRGMDNLRELYEKAMGGASCLLLPEHYSNLDLSLFSRLLRDDSERGKEIDRAVVAIAGLKLNESSLSVAAFAGAYTRLVIYPSRSLQDLDAEKDRAEIVRSNAINRAAMKALLDIKTKGRMVLVFPSGTRYRPWDPSTKKGVREIDSYIKSFDYFCPVAVNGEVLHVRRDGSGSMLDDYVSEDVVLITAGKIVSSAEFRARRRAEADAAGIADKKQYTVDGIMHILETMHNEAETERLTIPGAVQR